MKSRYRRVKTGIVAIAGLVIGVIGARAEVERSANHFQTGPPECSVEEAFVGLAEADLLAATTAEGYAEVDLNICQLGGGPCIVEAVALVIAQADVVAANSVLADAEQALEDCENGIYKLEPNTALEPIPLDLDSVVIEVR